MVRRVALVLVASSGCHVTTQTEVTRPATEEIVQHPEGAITLRPTLILSETGSLRFVQPLECPTERVVSSSTAIEIETKPNFATFVVGVIATAVGGVMTISGVAGKGSAANPVTYAGIGLVAVGMPFAVGPWTGLGKRLRDGGTTEPKRAPGPSVPCGARALPAKSATLTIRGLEVHGAVWQDGTFAISPYQLIDAYAPTEINAWEIAAIVDAEGGGRTIEAVIDGGAFAKYAPEFLAHADFNSKVEPMRLVPGLVPGALRASLTSTSAGPALRVVLAVKNDGPGATWGLRGQITSPTKSVDGRMLYIGHIGKGQIVSRELLIPLTVNAANTIRGTTLDISIELRDAHGTAPPNPVRFRGDVLIDAPR
jgi:hypothetical protein